MMKDGVMNGGDEEEENQRTGEEPKTRKDFLEFYAFYSILLA